MPDSSNSARIKSPCVALVVPNAGRRRQLSAALAGSQLTISREFDCYPSPADLVEISKLGCDAVIVDLDGEIDQALRAIEGICSHNNSTTVMAYSTKNDAASMRRSMQAGAREFLIEPLLPEAVSEAFARAVSRSSSKQKATGKTLVFLPAKGGVGMTTIAANFALALSKVSEEKVVLVDLDFELGEVALALGMTATFSVVDALSNTVRLDKEFLATLLLKHSSGLMVLAAPEDYNVFPAPAEGAGKLFQILREEFDYVVVDAGTCHSHIQETLFEVANTIYLVVEMSFPALRNARRVMSFLDARDSDGAVQLILNRFNSRHGDIDEASAAKALGRPINWRIPNCYTAARAAQDSGIPLSLGDSPIARALTQMARAACGKPFSPEAKPSRGFNFFGLTSDPEEART